MTRKWYALPLPTDWPEETALAFCTFAAALREGENAASELEQVIAHPGLGVGAASYVLRDLFNQGWVVDSARGGILVSPPLNQSDPSAEKDRVRRQELLRRDEQLSSPAVRRFIRDMERPREFKGQFVSIFSLMRDGSELAQKLSAIRGLAMNDSNWESLIAPYVQVIESPRQRCEHTGLRLTDVWRYFRHTWSTYYTSTPGRTMMILVRDRAAPFHPIIGIAALGSSVVQIRERDEWIGWQPEQVIQTMDASPSAKTFRWLLHRIESDLDELYVDDLISDGLYWPSLRESPNVSAIQQLEREAALRREYHRRFVRRSDFSSQGSRDWPGRARSDLFRSKRCTALADLLRAQLLLSRYFKSRPTKRGLEMALKDSRARSAIHTVLRRTKAMAVGTEIADLTVCGGVAPYSHLLGGKLVSLLSVSPTIVAAYHRRYAGYTSEIASSMAGRPITRQSQLAFIGTTSLYGSGSSQYNRLRIPKEVLNGTEEIRFLRLGTSKSYGTSHLSHDSLSALTQLAEQSRNGVRVNSIFGEGVSPKLRKVRGGLDQLGWPSDELLQHGRRRIVYGVALVSNLREYLLGLESKPKYIFPPSKADDVDRIVDWWVERWLRHRIEQDGVIDAVSLDVTSRPAQHRARVVLPSETSEDSQRLFQLEDL